MRFIRHVSARRSLPLAVLVPAAALMAAGPSPASESGGSAGSGAGTRPTVVLVPGSWGTRSAWRDVIGALGGPYRIVTTSLLGYGGTAERRTQSDVSMDREAEIVQGRDRPRGRAGASRRPFVRRAGLPGGRGGRPLPLTAWID